MKKPKKLNSYIKFVQAHKNLVAKVLVNNIKANKNIKYWQEMCTYEPNYVAGCLLTLVLNKYENK